jgi:hypothetical protein
MKVYASQEHLLLIFRINLIKKTYVLVRAGYAAASLDKPMQVEKVPHGADLHVEEQFNGFAGQYDRPCFLGLCPGHRYVFLSFMKFRENPCADARYRCAAAKNKTSDIGFSKARNIRKVANQFMSLATT